MRRKGLADLSAADLDGRRALVRVDFNVPLSGDAEVVDDTRIRATAPTLRFLIEGGARPVLLSHLGRPKGVADPRFSLSPVAPVLEAIVGAPVRFIGSTDTDEAVRASEDLEPGSVLLLENTRFLPGETANDPGLAARLARLGDLFVNDAFGSTHRAHASVVGVADHLRPSVAGLLVQRELESLGVLLRVEERPFVVVLGGAKIADKIGLLEAFLSRADSVVIGGGMANTFLAARNLEMGRSLVEADAIPTAREFLGPAGDRLRLPTDVVVAEPDASSSEGAEVVPVYAVPPDLAALDIGPETREAFGDVVRSARTVFWNGPMGLFERQGFDAGTLTLARAAAECTEAGGFVVVGGGDSARAIREAGLAHSVSHVSTGGGAALEYLVAGTLPGIEALDPV